MLALSFKSKLLAAMMLVVGGVTGATLFISEARFQEHYERIFRRLFEQQNQAFSNEQALLLENGMQISTNLAASTRMQFALDTARSDGTSLDLYQRVKSEFETRRLLETGGSFQPSFYLFVIEGKLMEAPPETMPGLKPVGAQNQLAAQLTRVGTHLQSQSTGYVTVETTEGRIELQQAIFVQVIDTKTGEPLGVLAMGFRIPQLGNANQFRNAGILFEGQLFSPSLPQEIRPELVARLAKAPPLVPDSAPDAQTGTSSTAALSPPKPADAASVISIRGEPHRLFYQPLQSDPQLPTPYLVALFSLREMLDDQAELRKVIGVLGGVGLAAAFGLSLLLSHGLSVPIRQLVQGTTEIQRGNFAVKVPVRTRDELGTLARSFNEMADGLALKEKYRSVLNVVADKEVAQELMKGNLSLGGELRDVSVLFCDIRGFTALTQGMAPGRVIEMLNEHFTPLTRVVNQHQGVVDKFVGDLIMANFGAPRSSGQDATRAVECALAMVHERRKLNQVSPYKIEMGIGIASGPVVAGCMGAENRLNYTVLGEQVNLASRLCSKAGRMEVVVDLNTREQLDEQFHCEPMPEMELKGFSQKVSAYKITLAPQAQSTLISTP